MWRTRRISPRCGSFDFRERPIAYAVVQVDGKGEFRLADVDGVVRLRLPRSVGDSVRLAVKRLGFREHFGMVGRAGADEPFLVRLETIQALDTVRATAVRATPLSRNGFYRRMEEAQRGAITAEFITPEELEVRGVSRVSQILQGRQSVRVGVAQYRGRSTPVLLGRGGACTMTVLLDGQRLHGMVEDVAGSAHSISTAHRGVPAELQKDKLYTSVDDVVDIASVAAIELYPSTANAPAELIPLTNKGSCGIVAIWTGGRR